MTRRTPDSQPSDTLPLDSIKVGKRFRQHMGDIDGLAASIAEHGLLHPIVVTPERLLIAGERRLLAVRQLGWTDVPVRVLAPRDLLRAEADENAVRLDFTPSEAVAVADALRPHVATPEGRPKLGQISPVSPGRTRDKIAAAVGMSGRTLEKAAAVVAAVEADPELAPIADEMDRSGNVDAAFRAVRKAAPADMAMTDVHRRKFPVLAAQEVRVQYTDALYSFGKPGKFEPEEWAERVQQLGPEDVARVRQHLAYIRRWLDRWEQLLPERAALALVGGSE